MTDLNSYDQGDLVRLTCETKSFDVNGVSISSDPTELTLKLVDPDGVLKYTYTWLADNQIHKASLGIFFWDQTMTTADEPGTWVYRWQATGAIIGAEEGKFFLRKASA